MNISVLPYFFIKIRIMKFSNTDSQMISVISMMCNSFPEAYLAWYLSNITFSKSCYEEFFLLHSFFTALSMYALGSQMLVKIDRESFIRLRWYHNLVDIISYFIWYFTSIIEGSKYRLILLSSLFILWHLHHHLYNVFFHKYK